MLRNPLSMSIPAHLPATFAVNLASAVASPAVSIPVQRVAALARHASRIAPAGFVSTHVKRSLRQLSRIFSFRVANVPPAFFKAFWHFSFARRTVGGAGVAVDAVLGVGVAVSVGVAV